MTPCFGAVWPKRGVVFSKLSKLIEWHSMSNNLKLKHKQVLINEIEKNKG